MPCHEVILSLPGQNMGHRFCLETRLFLLCRGSGLENVGICRCYKIVSIQSKSNTSVTCGLCRYLSLTHPPTWLPPSSLECPQCGRDDWRVNCKSLVPTQRHNLSLPDFLVFVSANIQERKVVVLVKNGEDFLRISNFFLLTIPFVFIIIKLPIPGHPSFFVMCKHPRNNAIFTKERIPVLKKQSIVKVIIARGESANVLFTTHTNKFKRCCFFPWKRCRNRYSNTQNTF